MKKKTKAYYDRAVVKPAARLASHLMKKQVGQDKLWKLSKALEARLESLGLLTIRALATGLTVTLTKAETRALYKRLSGIYRD